MLQILALLTLCLPCSGEEPVQADRQRVKSATTELEKAWKSDSAADRVRAIQTNGNVADAEVVKLVARGLYDKEIDVQRAAIESLRWIGHPDALRELQTLARDEKPFKKDPLLYAALLRAVGQYSSVSSLRILGDELWSVPDEHVIQARILGLGRIRARESLERLFELMRLSGSQRIEALMPDFRMALAVLTGVDQGNSEPGWQSWWKEHRVQWKVEEKRPPMPKDLERKWQVYWGETESDYRPKKRSERGRDGQS